MTDITVTLTVSDELCADIMCTALEGGIGYWSQASEIERIPRERPLYEGDFLYKSCKLHNTEVSDDEQNDPLTLNWDVIREGIAKLMKSKEHPTSQGATLRAIAAGDSGQIDAHVADVIVQFGIFGEEVYG